VLLDLAVAAVVTLSYLFTATYWPSIGDYFYSEVIEYTFATSTFDIWVLHSTVPLSHRSKQT